MHCHYNCIRMLSLLSYSNWRKHDQFMFNQLLFDRDRMQCHWPKDDQYGYGDNVRTALWTVVLSVQCASPRSSDAGSQA